MRSFPAHPRATLWISAFVLLLVAENASAQSEAVELLRQASQAADEGEHAKAVKLATDAIDKAPQAAAAYYLRGREQLRLGRAEEAVADLDKFVRLRPELEKRQWERGLAYYYAGEYKKGAEQFALYQTYYSNDVENAVWRYLCMAKDEGLEKARESLLPIQRDPRVPLMEAYALYRGEAKPDEVMAAARAGDPAPDELNERLFYGHLYVGLWHDAQGHARRARRHLESAVEHEIGHYMYDIARVHLERLKEQEK